MNVLQVSPHPDDELLGAPAMLFDLQASGSQITNLACTLGSNQGERSRRKAELGEACQRAGFNLEILDADHPEEETSERLREIVSDYDLVVSPSPNDRHPAHEAIARAVRKTLPKDKPWWRTALWGELRSPNVVHSFSEETLRKIQWALEAHRGEIERNDYCSLLDFRSRAAAILMPEIVFGFGSRGDLGKRLEVVSEVYLRESGWTLSSSRILDLANPLANYD